MTRKTNVAMVVKFVDFTAFVVGSVSTKDITQASASVLIANAPMVRCRAACA